ATGDLRQAWPSDVAERAGRHPGGVSDAVADQRHGAVRQQRHDHVTEFAGRHGPPGRVDDLDELRSGRDDQALAITVLAGDVTDLARAIAVVHARAEDALDGG